MISAILEVAIGVITGYLSLVFSHAVLAPRIKISPDIRVYWSDLRNKYVYSIRIKKTGLIDLIDVRVHCRLYVRDIYGKGVGIWEVYRIPTTHSNTLILSRRAIRLFLKLDELWLDAPQKHPALVRDTKIRIEEAGIRPEDFFMSFKDVYIQLFIIGVDRFTGVIKVFNSSKYYLHNIRFGDWDGMIVKEPHLNKP